MKCEWKTVVLGDICRFQAGSAFPKKEQGHSNGDIPFIKVSDMNLSKNTRKIYTANNWITKSTAVRMKLRLAPKESIVFAKIGEALKAERLRELVYDTAIDNNLMVAIPNQNIEKGFINFILENIHLARFAEGSALPYLRQGDLEAISISLPPKREQKKIVSILRTLDDKIELNNNINENLEQQAQSFYQELFVDKADSEWKEGTISDLGTVVGGSTPSKARPEYYTDKGIAWITPKDLSINKSKFIYHGENDITDLGMNNSSATIMPEGTVLFSSRAPIGYIAIAAGEVTTNQGFKSVIPHPEIGTAFVYYFLKNNLSIIEGMASGSTFKEISGSTMKRVPAFIPDKSSLTRFNEFCHPIFEKQKFLEKENVALASIRDALLPRLMSGELDVSELDI